MTKTRVQETENRTGTGKPTNPHWFFETTSDAGRPPPPADRGRGDRSGGSGFPQVLRDREGTRGAPHADTLEDGAALGNYS